MDATTAVEEVRTVGHGVVGVGFGNIQRSNLEAMFGTENYTLAALDGLPGALVERYRDEMPAAL
ncbi:hypothetical protein [Haladaptatus cibarius]|uniref:hypothetical protein n=1 Tax=Haladaptatus cibarius TaxID=453847 RepID=UPI000678D17C|nr:hypothetical protein [Haladaptatus cibarius]